MATDGRDAMAELPSKNDKFSTMDLDSNNVYIQTKHIKKINHTTDDTGVQVEVEMLFKQLSIAVFLEHDMFNMTNFVCSCNENVMHGQNLKIGRPIETRTLR